MEHINERHTRMRCAAGHERTVEFFDHVEAGKPVRHVACVRPTLGEVFPSYEGVWRDDGQLPRCPCGAGFVEYLSRRSLR